MRKVLVLGASGHLGQAVARRLREDSFYDDPIEAGRTSPLKVDLRSDDAIATLAGALDPETTLIHLAAWHPESTGSTTAEDRDALIETNVLGTMRALDAARQAGVKKVVYASTFEVYGLPDETPTTEHSRTYPLTDYGATKLSGEHHVQAVGDEEGIPWVALRMPAIYGPGESTPRALPNFLKRVAAGEAPVIFGDGQDLRDQLFIDDAARAIVESISSGQGVFNIADGKPHSIEEIAELAVKVSGKKLEIERRERTKERYDFHMSIERARTELNFRGGVSLEDGMRAQYEWLTGLTA